MEYFGLIFGSLLIVSALIYFMRAEHPRKIVWLPLTLGVFFCMFLILNERIIKITLDGLGSIEAAANQAKMYLEDIAQLRNQVEQQGELIDTVATRARAAKELSEKLAKDTKSAEEKLAFLDAAVIKAESRLASVKKIAALDVYRPLDAKRREQVVKSLSDLSRKETELKVDVGYNSGSRNREMLAKELVQLLKKSGIEVEGPAPSTRGFSPDMHGNYPSIYVEYNPKDSEYAVDFMKILLNLLNVTIHQNVTESKKEGSVDLFIYGEPLFSDQGVVGFR